MTDDLPPLPGDARLDTDQIARDQDRIRAVLAYRLEKMWRVVEPHLHPDNVRPDPRFLEHGVRILDRLGKVYRLDRDMQKGSPADAGAAAAVDRATVAAALEAMEARMQPPAPAQSTGE